MIACIEYYVAKVRCEEPNPSMAGGNMPNDEL